jgi:surface antigen
MGGNVFSRRGALTLVAAACAAIVVGAAGPAQAGAGTNHLGAGETLSANQSLHSNNWSYTAAMQGDGNFVLYTPSGARWSSRTGGQNGASIVMQGDGNLVMYKNGAVLWHTGTAGYNGASLAMQDDGNLVMYRNGAALWATSWHWTRGTTQASNTGAAGNCTWYAYERFKQFSGVYPSISGNAYAWNENAAARGWLVLNSPATQSVVVFEPGVQGASSLGHVAWVDFMQPRSDGTYIHVWEMNWKGLNIISDRWVKHVSGMSYIMAPQL